MKTKEVTNNQFKFSSHSKKILLKAFNQKVMTEKLMDKILSMDVILLQKKINKVGYNMKLNLVDKDK